MRDSKLTRQEIKKIATMACIRIADQELSRYADINKILEVIKKIDTVTTKNIKPFRHPFTPSQRLRKDKIGKKNSAALRKEYFHNAPKVKNNFYLIPSAIDE